jgi:hypothetical protein
MADLKILDIITVTEISEDNFIGCDWGVWKNGK